MKSYEDVQCAREELEFTVDRFLRSKGWVHTSSTPGSYWRWCKRVSWVETNRDDSKKSGFRKTTHTKDVMTDKETALSIQRFLDDVGK